MKIGILTQPLYCNYGGILQCFALQHTLQRIGHETCVIRREWNRQYTITGACKYYAKVIVKKIIDYSACLSLKNSAVLPTPRNGNGNTRKEGHRVFKLLTDCIVKRHYHTAADKSFAQCLRQAACNITQSSACLKGQSLT